MDDGEFGLRGGSSWYYQCASAMVLSVAYSGTTWGGNSSSESRKLFPGGVRYETDKASNYTHHDMDTVGSHSGCS